MLPMDARCANHDSQKAGAVKVRAGIVNAPGAEPLVGRFELPSRSLGTTSLQVIAAPLNPLDLLIASGTFHSLRHESPYVPGSECVGVVIDSDRTAQGTLVHAECHASPAWPGAFSTQVLVDDEHILLLPDGLDPVQAAAIGNSGVAAYMPLVETARIRSGDTVLILGATGAVGQIAVQIAKAKGAARVVGVGRDRAVLEHLKSLGADAVVELRAGEEVVELTDRLRDMADAVNIILDGLYGMPRKPRYRCVHHRLVWSTSDTRQARRRRFPLESFAASSWPYSDSPDYTLRSRRSSPHCPGYGLHSRGTRFV